jgi:hypothetical protein
MKALKSSFVKVLSSQMAYRGYLPMDVSMPMQTVYAFKKPTNSEMQCYIYFRYMVALKAYDITIGVESLQLQASVEKALEIFSARGGGLVFNPATSPTTRVLFNSDVFTKSAFGETLPAKVEALLPFLDALFKNAVIPIFEVVTDQKTLLKLLLRMDTPFDRSFFSRRFLFIVKLALETQSDWKSIRPKLLDVERLLRSDAYLEKYPGTLIDDAYAHFTKV